MFNLCGIFRTPNVELEFLESELSGSESYWLSGKRFAFEKKIEPAI